MNALQPLAEYYIAAAETASIVVSLHGDLADAQSSTPGSLKSGSEMRFEVPPDLSLFALGSAVTSFNLEDESNIDLKFGPMQDARLRAHCLRHSIILHSFIIPMVRRKGIDHIHGYQKPLKRRIIYIYVVRV